MYSWNTQYTRNITQATDSHIHTSAHPHGGCVAQPSVCITLKCPKRIYLIVCILLFLTVRIEWNVHCVSWNNYNGRWCGVLRSSLPSSDWLKWCQAVRQVKVTWPPQHHHVHVFLDARDDSVCMVMSDKPPVLFPFSAEQQNSCHCDSCRYLQPINHPIHFLYCSLA